MSGNIKTFKRLGECNRCGQCCKILPRWKDLPDIVKALFRMYDPNAEIVLSKVTYGVCYFLRRESDKIYTCSLYGNPERPKFCFNFPNEPSQIEKIPQCGYQFKEE